MHLDMKIFQWYSKVQLHAMQAETLMKLVPQASLCELRLLLVALWVEGEEQPNGRDLLRFCSSIVKNASRQQQTASEIEHLVNMAGRESSPQPRMLPNRIQRRLESLHMQDAGAAISSRSMVLEPDTALQQLSKLPDRDVDTEICLRDEICRQGSLHHLQEPGREQLGDSARDRVARQEHDASSKELQLQHERQEPGNSAIGTQTLPEKSSTTPPDWQMSPVDQPRGNFEGPASAQALSQPVTVMPNYTIRPQGSVVSAIPLQPFLPPFHWQLQPILQTFTAHAPIGYPVPDQLLSHPPAEAIGFPTEQSWTNRTASIPPQPVTSEIPAAIQAHALSQQRLEAEKPVAIFPANSLAPLHVPMAESPMTQQMVVPAANAEVLEGSLGAQRRLRRSSSSGGEALGLLMERAEALHRDMSQALQVDSKALNFQI